jgi:hypothetical protein
MDAETARTRGKTRPIDQRIDEALKRKQQLEAKIARLDAARKAKERRLETRRAFLIGQAVLTEHALRGTAARALREVLDEHVTRPADRAVIADLLKAG